MSYSILEINGTKISRRLITNIWWKRKNPYLRIVVGCDDSLIENKYRYLPLSDACFLFLNGIPTEEIRLNPRQKRLDPRVFIDEFNNLTEVIPQVQ